ncbi:MAG: hypothetical protein ABI068_00180 [Ktedonobacterales bacterium]
MVGQTCLRCGAAYDDGATVCFTCGAPIGEIETPTQPVRTPQMPPRAAPETREYPATASTAPAAVGVASKPVYDDAANGASARVSMKVGGGGDVHPTQAPPMRQRTWRRWPLIALVTLVVLAFLGGGAIELRALLAGPPVAKSQVYADPQHRFHFTRPTLWQVTTESDGALVTDSSGVDSAQISVGRMPTSAPPQKTAPDAAQIADALATQLGGLQAAPAQTFAGATWEQRTGTVTGADGAVRKDVVLVTVRDTQVYTIELSSPTSSYDNTNNLVYQPLLASFQFG